MWVCVRGLIFSFCISNFLLLKIHWLCFISCPCRPSPAAVSSWFHFHIWTFIYMKCGNSLKQRMRLIIRFLFVCLFRGLRAAWRGVKILGSRLIWGPLRWNDQVLARFSCCTVCQTKLSLRYLGSEHFCDFLLKYETILEQNIIIAKQCVPKPSLLVASAVF